MTNETKMALNNGAKAMTPATLAYLNRTATCWTVTFEGVTRMPTYIPLPLAWTPEAPWQAVASYVAQVFGARVYYNGSQVA